MNVGYHVSVGEKHKQLKFENAYRHSHFCTRQFLPQWTPFSASCSTEHADFHYRISETWIAEHNSQHNRESCKCFADIHAATQKKPKAQQKRPTVRCHYECMTKNNNTFEENFTMNGPRADKMFFVLMLDYLRYFLWLGIFCQGIRICTTAKRIGIICFCSKCQ